MREEDAVREAAERVTQTKADKAKVEARIDALATLSRLDYERERKAAAEELGLRATALDAEVAARRPAVAGASADELAVPTVEPAAGSVSGATALDEAVALIREHVVCDEHVAVAAALWCAVTYLAAEDCIATLPLAIITAPEKGCGKTRLLGALSRLVQRPLPAANVSSAALYRVIEKVQPTLLIDEADTFIRFNIELRGVINSGHTRDSAFVLRCDGDDHEPRRFSTWCPKALSGIGKMPATLEDRSLKLALRRKLSGETVGRFRDSEQRFRECAGRLARFAQDSIAAVRGARPELPELGSDRAADNWEPLLALADAAGGDWSTRARAAAAALTTTSERTSDSRGVMLLADLRQFFTVDPCGAKLDGAPTKVLLGHLEKLTERPWPTCGKKGGPISDRQLADLLRPFEITSRTGRFSLAIGPAKGYLRASFEDAWARYLPTDERPS